MIMQQKLFDNDYQIRSIEKYQLSDILDASVKRMRAQVTDRSSDQNERSRYYRSLMKLAHWLQRIRSHARCEGTHMDRDDFCLT